MNRWCPVRGKINKHELIITSITAIYYLVGLVEALLAQVTYSEYRYRSLKEQIGV